MADKEDQSGTEGKGQLSRGSCESKMGPGIKDVKKPKPFSVVGPLVGRGDGEVRRVGIMRSPKVMTQSLAFLWSREAPMEEFRGE